jgi:dipeptidyl aminopeptidase/acylaminoacyl peptidase
MAGPNDIVTMFDGADERRSSALIALLGGPLTEKRALAESASPMTYLNPKNNVPPFFFVHGINDQVVPVQQAKIMAEKLKAFGATPQLLLLPQTGHDLFTKVPLYNDAVKEFFISALAQP